jgi:hypothetical protein
MEPIISWLVALMVLVSPPEVAAVRSCSTRLPGACETPDERLTRYRDLATAMAEEATARPLYGGRAKVANTAALYLAITYFESGWRRDVDLGIGSAARGGGVDSCVMQIRLGKGMVTQEGYDWTALVADRRKCVESGARLVRQSFNACRDLPPEERLAAYASGSCSNPVGKAKSRERVLFARRLLSKLPPPSTPLGA